MVRSVFLSSTFGDFKEERRALVEAIPYIDLHVHTAERKGFKPGKTLEEHLKEWIEEADAVVLLVGLRYGSKSDDGVSWTEKEIRYALSKGKCIFGYIREHPEIDLKNIDVSTELGSFVKTIEKEVTVIPRYS